MLVVVVVVVMVLLLCPVAVATNSTFSNLEHWKNALDNIVNPLYGHVFEVVGDWGCQ